MALVDDLKDYIKKNSADKTDISEQHDVAVIGETHEFLMTAGSEIRTRATVRLLLELLADIKYRYFANESYMNKGRVRRGVRKYLKTTTLPPAFDAKEAGVDLEDVAERVLVRRFQEVLDFLRANPRYILSIGSQVTGAGRDARLAQHFFEEMEDRKLNRHVPGLLLLGSFHAAAVSDRAGRTTRMLLEDRGFTCISIRVLTDLEARGSFDDAIVPLGKPADIMRLSSLVTKSPVTIPTDRPWGTKHSPFQQVSFGDSENSVASQFDYVVIQKA
jgi:hypothetical protein